MSLRVVVRVVGNASILIVSFVLHTRLRVGRWFDKLAPAIMQIVRNFNGISEPSYFESKQCAIRYCKKGIYRGTFELRL